MLALPLVPVGAVAAEQPDAVFNGGFEIGARDARPVMCEVLGDGYINVFEPGNPYGLPWLVILNPCHSSAVKATHWSSGKTVDIEDDGTGNHVARFIAGSTDENTGANHNMWQAYPSPHQAFTPNAEAYELTVVEGDIPSGAIVRLSLSVNPFGQANGRIDQDCTLVFNSALLNANMDGDGRISLDPTDGSFGAPHSSCKDLKTEWDAASAGSDERRAVLDQTRIVQHSFWSWNSGSEDVFIDNVSMPGSQPTGLSLLS